MPEKKELLGGILTLERESCEERINRINDLEEARDTCIERIATERMSDTEFRSLLENLDLILDGYLEARTSDVKKTIWFLGRPFTYRTRR